LLEAEIVHTNPLHVLAALGVVPTANALELAAAYARRAQQSLLAGSVAVVTGGSRGIGAAIAQALAEAGAAVGLIGRSREALATAADDLRARGAGSVRFAAADAGDPERLEAALGRLAAELGPVTVLVNNAGMIERGAAEELTIEQWDRVIAVNLRAAFVAARTVFPGMREHGSGSIVNVTSLSGRFGIRRAAPYGASKGGLTQLTRALALEWAPHGIRVNAVAPGYVTTAFTERLATDRKRHRQILERIPLGRWGRPDDVGGTVVYLASGLSAYVTGQLVIVDGGYSVDG
jgi:NAD(P)-dependent dehydrogenase (short-subunit alcohol dehydrogenase family)